MALLLGRARAYGAAVDAGPVIDILFAYQNAFLGARSSGRASFEERMLSQMQRGESGAARGLRRIADAAAGAVQEADAVNDAEVLLFNLPELEDASDPHAAPAVDLMARRMASQDAAAADIEVADTDGRPVAEDQDRLRALLKGKVDPAALERWMQAKVHVVPSDGIVDPDAVYASLRDKRHGDFSLVAIVLRAGDWNLSVKSAYVRLISLLINGGAVPLGPVTGEVEKEDVVLLFA
jgi:hypothetical protein